jgi:hypothetical protein
MKWGNGTADPPAEVEEKDVAVLGRSHHLPQLGLHMRWRVCTSCACTHACVCCVHACMRVLRVCMEGRSHHLPQLGLRMHAAACVHTVCMHVLCACLRVLHAVCMRGAAATTSRTPARACVQGTLNLTELRCISLIHSFR